ncbi:hypothetical protein PtB15_1B350 [Puccinia triticina]|nr:hypothetical protein PtB15_1B350 [Puccinia triticina]
MPHNYMFQVQSDVVANPPPAPAPNSDTLDAAALLFAGSVFNSQTHNLTSSPPTLQLLGQNLLSMSRIAKRKLEEEDPREPVSPALRKFLKDLENKMDDGFKKVDDGLKKLDRRSKRRFGRIEKRLDKIEGILNDQIEHVKDHPYNNLTRLEPSPAPGGSSDASTPSSSLSSAMGSDP